MTWLGDCQRIPHELYHLLLLVTSLDVNMVSCEVLENSLAADVQ